MYKEQKAAVNHCPDHATTPPIVEGGRGQEDEQSL